MSSFGKFNRRVHHSITSNHHNRATTVPLLVTVQIHNVLHIDIQSKIPECTVGKIYNLIYGNSCSSSRHTFSQKSGWIRNHSNRTIAVGFVRWSIDSASIWWINRTALDAMTGIPVMLQYRWSSITYKSVSKIFAGFCHFYRLHDDIVLAVKQSGFRILV